MSEIRPSGPIEPTAPSLGKISEGPKTSLFDNGVLSIQAVVSSVISSIKARYNVNSKDLHVNPAAKNNSQLSLDKVKEHSSSVRKESPIAADVEGIATLCEKHPVSEWIQEFCTELLNKPLSEQNECWKGIAQFAQKDAEVLKDLAKHHKFSELAEQLPSNAQFAEGIRHISSPDMQNRLKKEVLNTL